MKGRYLEKHEHDMSHHAWWHSEKRTITQIEALMVLCVLLFAIQVILGWWRRCRCSAFIKYPLWLAYTLTPYLATYTFGIMHSSLYLTQDALFVISYISLVVWSMSLVLALGGTYCNMIAYDVDDNKQYMRHLFRHCYLISIVFPTVMFDSNWNSYLLGVCFTVILPLSISPFIFPRTCASMMASSFSDMASLHLQDYMEVEHTKSTDYDPITLRGYNYLFTEDITISQIWLSNEGPLGSSDGARFKLLRRRFFGAPCPEARLQKTHDLIFQGLLFNVEENYQSAYRVIEAELAFAHDFFFTKASSFAGISNVHFEAFRLFGFSNICGIAGSSLWLIFVHSLYAIIIRVTILVLLSLELLQLYVYVSSDWAKLEIVRRFISGGDVSSGIFRLGNKLPQLFGCWQSKIGQHSLLKDLHSRSVTADVMGSLFHIFRSSHGYIPASPTGFRHPGVNGADRILLTNDVKLAIARTLKASNGELSNGASTLHRNDLDHVFLPCNQSHAGNMLIWHIATEYCDIAQSCHTAEQYGMALNRTVAGTLSRYCAYLMAFVPELLPGHHVQTTARFHEVRCDALDFLREERSLQSKYTKMRSYNQQLSEALTIFQKGICVGEKLEEITDDGRRWKILADLWAEMTLYIAPSDNAKDHIQHLANGGEFLTHLWALLSHAGILERDQQIPRENIQNSVSPREIEETPASHEGTTSTEHLMKMSNSLQLARMLDAGSVIPPSRHRPVMGPLPPLRMRRATELLFPTHSWSVFNAAARRFMLIPGSPMGGFALQAPPPTGVRAGLPPLPALDITPANEHRVDIPEVSSSTRKGSIKKCEPSSLSGAIAQSYAM